mmetsp:Transcript_15703/g.37299  ORF Transcript_15703/g.37299 Transcript_15703/m.37299 type:complete len:243 (+) Transcript_15703:250-978(+)
MNTEGRGPEKGASRQAAVTSAPASPRSGPEALARPFSPPAGSCGVWCSGSAASSTHDRKDTPTWPAGLAAEPPSCEGFSSAGLRLSRFRRSHARKLRVGAVRKLHLANRSAACASSLRSAASRGESSAAALSDRRWARGDPGALCTEPGAARAGVEPGGRPEAARRAPDKGCWMPARGTDTGITTASRFRDEKRRPGAPWSHPCWWRARGRGHAAPPSAGWPECAAPRGRGRRGMGRCRASW